MDFKFYTAMDFGFYNFELMIFENMYTTILGSERNGSKGTYLRKKTTIRKKRQKELRCSSSCVSSNRAK